MSYVSVWLLLYVLRLNVGGSQSCHLGVGVVSGAAMTPNHKTFK